MKLLPRSVLLFFTRYKSVIKANLSPNIISGEKLTENQPKKTVGQHLFDSVAKFPDRTWQIDAVTGEFETYANLNKRSIRLAIELLNLKLTSKDVIVSLSSNCIDCFVTNFGTLYAGSIIANIDPLLSERQIKHLLAITKPTMIFVQESEVKRLEKVLNDLELKPRIVVYASTSKTHQVFNDLIRIQPGEQDFKPIIVDLNESSVIMFSSGTSNGLPKAICHTHKSILNMLNLIRYYDLQRTEERLLYFASPYWISTFLLIILMADCGATGVFISQYTPKQLFELIQKYKITVTFFVPLQSLILTNFPQAKDYDITSLTHIIMMGTPISPAQYKNILTKLPHATLIFGYGLTESGIITLFHRKTQKDLIKTKISSCGKLLPTIQAKILDTETGELLGPNKTGEIRIKSCCNMLKYYQTKTEVFDNDGFIKTGDLGYYDEDHCFFVVDRNNDMFFYKGTRIIPSLIEGILMEHPAVEEAVVFGTPTGFVELGEEPTACVVLKPNVTVAENELIEFVDKFVVDVDRLRGGIFFRESFPKTPSGKIMRYAVKQLLVEVKKN